MQTADIVNQRPVDPIFIEGFFHHLPVAIPAQLRALLFGL